MDEFITGNTELNLEFNIENEADASIANNPSLTMCRFILTDDSVNLNKERIPLDEFDNLIRTGMYMPIKMAVGSINDGHDNALPLGVISHLKKVNNQIYGLAALWGKERPEDINYIKERYNKKEPLQLSWEVLYGNSTTSEDGVKDLRETALRAVTLVGMPAYAGRTPIVAVASETGGNEPPKDETLVIKSLGENSNLEDYKLEELEKLQSEKAELLSAKESLLKEKETLVTDNETLKNSVSTLTTELDATKTELVSTKTQLETLVTFKAEIDKKQEDETKFSAIKTKFKEAGLERDDEYFSKNRDTLLGLPDTALDFMIQETVSFPVNASTNTTISSTRIPPVTPRNTSHTTEELAQALRARISK